MKSIDRNHDTTQLGIDFITSYIHETFDIDN